MQKNHFLLRCTFIIGLWFALQANANASITVLVKNASTHAPLANATVLIGTQEGAPFAGNKATTAADGSVTFSDPSLSARAILPVTAQLAGFSAYTLLTDTTNPTIELDLEPNPDPAAYSFLSGKVLGFPKSDNQTLDIGFFAPALKTNSFLSFNPQDIVSSYTVQMDVYGKHDVPGNVVLPTQDKTYFIFPVHLDKPSFNMPLPNGLNTHMIGLTSTVNLAEAIKDIGNKDFLSILNLANFNHIKWTNRLTVAGTLNFDIPADQALVQQSLTGTYKNIPAGLDTVALSLLDPEQDRGDFVTMDIKSLPAASAQGGAGQIKLASLAQRIATDDYYIFSAVLHQTDFTGVTDREHFTSRAVAGNLQQVSQQATSANFDGFFQLIKTKSISADYRTIQFNSPNTSTLKADFILVNLYSEALNSLTKGVTHKVLWSAKLPGDAVALNLPNLGQAVLPKPDAASKEYFYVEIVAVKAPPGTDLSNTQNAIQNIQHVSSFVQKL